MTDKTMPERIWACRDKVVDIRGGTVEEGWHTEPQFDGEAEYVRADLARGDANEPLVGGQMRWVMHDKTWSMGVVGRSVFSGKINIRIYHPVSVFVNIDDIENIGPVIRPPEDV